VIGGNQGGPAEQPIVLDFTIIGETPDRLGEVPVWSAREAGPLFGECIRDALRQ
jgi:hypothetical protein